MRPMFTSMVGGVDGVTPARAVAGKPPGPPPGNGPVCPVVVGNKDGSTFDAEDCASAGLTFVAAAAGLVPDTPPGRVSKSVRVDASRGCGSFGVLG
jgi:hypothetical protein